MNKKALVMMMNSRPNGETHHGKNMDEPMENPAYVASAPHADKNDWHHENAQASVFTAEMADKWTDSMVNADGTTGAHWSKEQVKQIMAQNSIEADLKEFWVIINSIYSDYCGVAKKHNVNTIAFYADMAKAWLYDADAIENKAWAYYDYIVKH